MHRGAAPPTRRGLVVSDLHLFARRSVGDACFQSLRAELASVDLLVLNGDIFDFRWSTLRGHHATVQAAVMWLRQLAAELPRCEIHYVLGNHDCLELFQERLPHWCAGESRLHWHEHQLRLGSALFLHGDCSVGHYDLAALRSYRSPWEHDSQRSPFAAHAYRLADRLGMTALVHRWHFPREQTVARVVYHLDQTQAGWKKEIRDCYFGHTHLPFAHHPHAGVNFHNTGSAIRGMKFNPIRFAVPPGNTAFCATL
ncbi:MAG: hypothetical protein IT580_24400 [Verrucomicrobiales bacterium]|nr:hypothetical protein [Verrucomicrobiales bacterium]